MPGHPLQGGLAPAVLIVLTVLAAACGDDVGAAAPTAGAQPTHPHVIVIVVDTLRADVLLADRGTVPTPNIDALARDGVPFVQAFTHAPSTLPAHTSLFSSRRPFETGVLSNGMRVPPDLPLLSEHLASLGYQTLAAVSLGTLWPFAGPGTTLDRGFGTYAAVPGHVVPASVMCRTMADLLDGAKPGVPLFFFAHFSDPHEPYNRYPTPRQEPSQAVLLVDGRELETVTTSEATYWTADLMLPPGIHAFELRSDEPTDVRILQVFAQGAPVQQRRDDAEHGKPVEGEFKPTRHAVAAFENTSDEALHFRIEAWVSDVPRHEDIPERYLGEVAFADRYVGELVAELKRRGLYDDSILVFTSDHGEALGEHGHGGHVDNLYDELTHVPLIVKPADRAARKRLAKQSRDLVRHLDVVPTILELAGLPPLPGQRGLSLLRGDERFVVSETYRPEAPQSQVSIRSADLKLIYFAEEDRFELFDLKRDPKELASVFDERGGEVAEWQEQLRTTARQALEAEARPEDLSEEQRESMRALGYMGD